jgi:CRISPR/Cas system CMR-associated protein Cmr5 small subunit
MIEVFAIFLGIGAIVSFYLNHKEKIDNTRKKLDEPLKDIFD